MSVRPATQEDLSVVRELWEALYAECPEPEHESKPWEAIAEDVRRGIDEFVVLIALDEDAPVGFLIAYPRRERVGYVSDLYVRPGQRGRGVARELLREGVRRLDREIVQLDVDATNGRARSFYERLGFTQQSQRLVIRAEQLA